MFKMIIFIYGSESYFSKKRLDFLKSEFYKKYGDINVISVDGSTIDLDFNLTNHLQIAPFLSEKKMIIIKNFLSLTKDKATLEKIEKSLTYDNDYTVLVFYESGIGFDKRQSLFKYLKVKAKNELYNALNRNEIKNLVLERIKDEGLEISSEAINYFISIFEEGQKEEDGEKNTWSLMSELDKLSLYVKSNEKKEIEINDIKEITSLLKHAKIFDLIDYIGKKDQKRALEEISNLLLSGENEYYILTMIVYQFRLLIKIKSLTYKEATREKIVESLKIHPFVIAKGLDQVKNYTLDELKDIYFKIMQLEGKMKGGQTEPEVALCSFVAEVSK